MNAKQPVNKTLEEIHATEQYEQLEPFKEPSKWKGLEKNDLTLLAKLFIKKGQMDTQNPDYMDQAEESFETAVKLLKNDLETLLSISRVWGAIEEWDRAIEWVNKALKINAEWLEALLELSALYVLKGKALREESYFEDALKIFENLNARLHILPPEVSFKWGQAYHCLGRISQEPCDLTHACEKYRIAENDGCIEKHLFFDHALALSELATLVARAEHVHESLLYLLKSVEIDPHFHDGWIYLAITYKFLYERGDKSEYYDRAESAFYTASRINTKNKMLWLSWGQMLLNEGRVKRNYEVVSLAIEKIQRADNLFPNDRDVQCFLADALMVLGLFDERYELLKEAKEKIEECLRSKPDDSAVLFLYGTCLVHMGKYFHDENMIRQSFEKFEKSIQLNGEDPHVWHSLGLAYYTYGDMTSDPIMLEKAIELFDRTHKLLKSTDSDLFNNWGVGLMKLAEVTGDLLPMQVAADKFEQAIAHHHETKQGRDPDPEWYYNYGCALDYLGDFYQDASFYEKSVQVLTHVINAFPAYTQARYNLALSLTHFGDALGDIESLELGLTHFDRLLQEDPEDEMYLMDMGIALMTLGDLAVTSDGYSQSKKAFEEAETKLLQSIALGNSGAFFWMGCLYSISNNFPECVRYLEKARDNDALPCIEDLKDEKWLENLRMTEMWRPFINSLPAE